LVSCPVCRENVAKPVRRIDAPNFKIVDYECGNCGKRFRIIG
jgi:C4-type Zn-finger protein